MNEFEKLLLEKCPQYMVLLFAKNYAEQTTQAFKDYVSEHFKELLPKEALLIMPLDDFFEYYAPEDAKNLKVRLWNMYRYDKELNNVGDLLSLGEKKLSCKRNVGKKCLDVIRRTYENAGLEFK